jgi:uncharacterized protein with HEPN domain
MRFPRIKISMRCLLFLVALIGAYLSGVASKRSELAREWNELRLSRDRLIVEKEEAELAKILQNCRVTLPADLDRIESLLDELDACEARVPGNGRGNEAERVGTRDPARK